MDNMLFCWVDEGKTYFNFRNLYLYNNIKTQRLKKKHKLKSGGRRPLDLLIKG